MAAQVQGWLGEQEASGLTISDWTSPKMSSAMAIKLRTGQTDLTQRATALAMSNRLVADSLTVLPVSGSPTNPEIATPSLD